MKSNICKLNEDLACLEEVLAEVEKVTTYNGLEDKKALRIRLLAEELCGMLPGLINNFSGKFWAENDGEDYQHNNQNGCQNHGLKLLRGHLLNIEFLGSSSHNLTFLSQPDYFLRSVWTQLARTTAAPVAMC